MQQNKQKQKQMIHEQSFFGFLELLGSRQVLLDGGHIGGAEVAVLPQVGVHGAQDPCQGRVIVHPGWVWISRD